MAKISQTGMVHNCISTDGLFYRDRLYQFSRLRQFVTTLTADGVYELSADLVLTFVPAQSIAVKDVASIVPVIPKPKGKSHSRYLSNGESVLDVSRNVTPIRGETVEEYAARNADITSDSPLPIVTGQSAEFIRHCRYVSKTVAFREQLRRDDCRNCHWTDFVGLAFDLYANRTEEITIRKACWRAYRSHVASLTDVSFSRQTRTAEYRHYLAEIVAASRVALGRYAGKIVLKQWRAEYMKNVPFVGRRYESSTTVDGMGVVRRIGNALKKQRAQHVIADASVVDQQRFILSHVDSVESAEEAGWFADALRSFGCSRYVEYRLQGLSETESYRRIAEERGTSRDTERRWHGKRIAIVCRRLEAVRDGIRSATIVENWDTPLELQPVKATLPVDAKTAELAVKSWNATAWQ